VRPRIVARLKFLDAEPLTFRRFTIYNFKQMKRRSYYPSTQIVSTMTITSSTGAGVSRPTTPLTPSGENPPLPNNYEMREKELQAQEGQDQSYEMRPGSAF
jgi:hypothetical protein